MLILINSFRSGLANADESVANDVVVVVNKANRLASLNKKQVIDIYMGRYLSFPDGKPAEPIDFPSNTAEKASFYLKLVNKEERKIKSYWSRLLFSGRARPPLEAESMQDVVALVEQKQDAIAYLPRNGVTSEMKIVYEFNQ
ncbi:hypothetical protein KIU71_17345 [Alteromonas sp. SM 2104]|nr:hypothetical protein [Alteromonas oceanisediminis]